MKTIEEKRKANLKSVHKYHQTEKGKANRKRYFQSEKCKASLKRYRQSKEGKIANNAKQKRFRIRYPERFKARHAVSYVVFTGRLPHPDTLQCSYGNHPAEQYHHHKGYEPEFWLDVIPVCQRCHTKIHRKEVA